MRTDRNAVRAGLFILAAFVLMVLLVLGIKGFEQILQPARLHTAQFSLADNVGGLQLGDPVRIGGYQVGTVRAIEIVGGDDDKKVEILFAIPSKYTLKSGTVLRVEEKVTGSSCLNIESLGKGDAIADGAPIIGRPSALSEITASASAIAPRMREIIDGIQQRTIPAIDKAIAKAALTADAFTQTADTTTQTIADARSLLPALRKRYEQAMDAAVAALNAGRDFIGPPAGDFRATMANLSQSTAAIKDKLPAMMDRIDAAVTRIDSAVASASAALKDIEVAATNTKQISASVKAVIVGNRGKLDGMIASLKSTSDNLKGASIEIRRSPWRLLYKPTAAEMDNLNLYDSARQFAEGANDLNDSIQAVRDAIQNGRGGQGGQGNEAELKTLLESMHKSFDNFRQVEQKLWTEVKR